MKNYISISYQEVLDEFSSVLEVKRYSPNTCHSYTAMFREFLKHTYPKAILDQFENIGCCFQFYQWFGLEMDPYFYFELTETRRISDNKYEITVGLADRSGDTLTKYIPVTVERNNNLWLITDIAVSWK